MKRWLVLLPISMAGLLASCAGDDYYGPRGPGGWGSMPMMNYGFGYGYGGMFMWIIFLVVIGLLIYFVVQARNTKGPTPVETPLDILKKRYAKGEITKEEFDRMKNDLGE